MLSKESESISFALLAAILATGILTFAGIVAETAMNVTFPTLMQEFNISTSTVQWLTTGNLLCAALIVPLSSYFKERFKLKSIFKVASMLFLFATLTCAFAPNFTILLLGRLFQGMATGLALPLMFNIVLEQAPRSRIGVLMGVATFVIVMAPALGPVLGGFLVDIYGWRMIFYSLIPILLISAFLGIKYIKQVLENKYRSFDLKSYIFLIISFTAFIFAIVESSTLGWVNTKVMSLLAVAFIAIYLFQKLSRQSTSPIIRLEALTNKSFLYSMMYILLTAFNILALGFLIPNYAQLVSNSSATIAGMLLLPGCVIAVVLAPTSGYILDTLGAKKPILLGSVLVIVSMIFFNIFASHQTTKSFIIIYIIFAIGQGLSLGNSMTHGLRQLPIRLTADGNAIISTLQQLFNALGTCVTASIVASYQNEMPNDLAQGTVNGSVVVFIVLLSISIIAFIFTFRALQLAKDD